jgi:hypothetical protein
MKRWIFKCFVKIDTMENSILGNVKRECKNAHFHLLSIHLEMKVLVELLALCYYNLILKR